MYYTTLNNIRSYKPCRNGWTKLLRHLGKTAPDDEPVSLRTILESNGLDDASWALRAVDDPACARDARLFGVRCVRQVQHLLIDQRLLDALDVAERHAIGEATDEELEAAWEAAWEAWDVARDAWAAGEEDEFNGIFNDAWDDVLAAAEAAAYAVARDAAWEALLAASGATTQDALRQDFIDIFCR